LRDIPDGSVQTCVTSPPYWGLRDYGHDRQIGLELTPEQYVAELVEVFREVRRVLADDGTLWLNLGDSYAGSGKGAWGSRESAEANRHSIRETYIPTRAQSPLAGVVPVGLKPKDLVGIPWRVAFALQADGWWLRQDIIWAKPNPMPESVTDRCTKSHEYLFLLTKAARYFYDIEPIREPVNPQGQQISGASMSERGAHVLTEGSRKQPEHIYDEPKGANRRSVWRINTKPFHGAHFAVMPTALAEPCVLAGSRFGDIVLDPFTGSGTVAVVALRHNRHFVGIELNPEYAAIAKNRILNDGPLFNEVVTK